MKNLLAAAACCLFLPALQARTSAFTENNGQVADMNGQPASQVLFSYAGNGPAIFITDKGLTYVLSEKKNDTVYWSSFSMELLGAQIRKEYVKKEKSIPGTSSYYLAHCPQGISGVKSWQKITVREVYPGIDWEISAGENGVEYDFIVRPGANPLQVKMRYNGVDPEITDHNENILQLKTRNGIITEGPLKSFVGHGKKQDLLFYERSNNIISYRIPEHSEFETIILDPPLQWANAQAGSGTDIGYSVYVSRDGTGDIFTAGTSDGMNFPVLNATQGFMAGQTDMIIQRVDPSGNRIWSTYYGGLGVDEARAVCVNGIGDCFVAGFTMASSFPVFNPIQTNFGGGTDAAFLKFNGAGQLQRATWYGGSGNDYATAIDCDINGKTCATGYTNSSNFPTMNPMQSSKGVGYDAFVMRFDDQLSIDWATFFGGDDDDRGRAIAIDQSALYLYIAGSTMSGSFSTTFNGFQNTNASAYTAEDVFVAKINTSLQTVAFASYCGGSGADFGQGIAIDPVGNIFVTGYTLSSDFPVRDPGTPNAYVDSGATIAGTHNAFVFCCSNIGNVLHWSTYYGGTGTDLGTSVAINPAGSFFITGMTASTDLTSQVPPDFIYHQPAHGDGGIYNDMFIAGFNRSDYSLQWSTYYGDANNNEGRSIACDSLNNIYITGSDSLDMALLKFANGIFLSAANDPLSENKISCWPVPAHDQLFLSLTENAGDDFTVEIFSVTGQLVKKEMVRASGSSVKLDVSNLPQGMYSVRVSGENDFAARFVKD